VQGEDFSNRNHHVFRVWADCLLDSLARHSRCAWHARWAGLRGQSKCTQCTQGPPAPTLSGRHHHAACAGVVFTARSPVEQGGASCTRSGAALELEGLPDAMTGGVTREVCSSLRALPHAYPHLFSHLAHTAEPIGCVMSDYRKNQATEASPRHDRQTDDGRKRPTA